MSARDGSQEDASDSVLRLVLNHDSTKHAQVRGRLLELLATMERGSKLPPEREMAALFGVSRMTLRQAISDLADAGYVSRLQGSGTFVSEPTISKNSDLTGFSEDMAARGFSSSSRLIAVTRVPAGPIRGPELVLSPADPILHIERVRMADGIPMCLETVDIPADLVPGLESQALTGSLYEILRSQYGLELVEANQVITATVVDQTEADLLRVPVHSPALIVKRLGIDRHRRPVERAISVYRADRYDVQLTVKRRVL